MQKKKIKVLFIYKLRKPYGCSDEKIIFSFGLSNSARFVAEALNELGSDRVEAKVVGVIDNNGIDRVVHEYQPTHVIIEALWVVPEKFDVLMKLHPHVKWNVRIHSKTPFLANEGIAFEWIDKYMDIKGLTISGNNAAFVSDIRKVYRLNDRKMAYLPNIYPVRDSDALAGKLLDGVLSVGCFGSLRPMKNTLQQAVASIILADKMKKTLYFHVNSRAEQGGEQILKNLRALFDGQPHHLVIHDWMPHKDFIGLVRCMDIGLQVSMTESFNIVTADFVCQNVPIIVSKDVSWINNLYKADPNCAEDIAKKMKRALWLKKFNVQYLNKINLTIFSEEAIDDWLDYLIKSLE
jgi:hypothetical protein